MTYVKGKKVLIVEDEKDFLWILREGFNNQGLSMLYASSGEEGVVLAKEENPDLIIIDIGLPQMDGIAMARKIKEEGGNAKLIFLTNMKDAEHVSEAIDISGEADYIVKADIRVEDIVARAKDKLGLK